MFPLSSLSAKRRKARQLTRRADAARDSSAYSDAAMLYEAVLRLCPTFAIHVQCGNMLKDSGSLAQAEEQYLAAYKEMPNDPDLSIQFGHLYKIWSRWPEAIAAYERAEKLGVPAPTELRFCCRKQALHVVGTVLEQTFDKERYLHLNPEVRAAEMHPLDHFVRYGAREGRPVREMPAFIDLTRELWDRGVPGR